MKLKNANDFNRAQMHQNELTKMRNQFKDIAASYDAQRERTPESNITSQVNTEWSTTNRDFLNAKIAQD